MNTLRTNLVSAGVFFLFIFLSGFWLSRTGRPYSMLIQTLHKLIGVAAGVYLVRTVYQIHEAAPLSSLGIVAVVVTVLFFAGLVATGGLLSASKTMPGIVSGVHKLFPYLAFISTGVMIYLLF